MGKGKIAAQCAHSALGAYRKIADTDEGTTGAWLACGQPKIALQVADEAELQKLYQEARAAGLNAHIVHDAGRTQVNCYSIVLLLCVSCSWPNAPILLVSLFFLIAECVLIASRSRLVQRLCWPLGLRPRRASMPSPRI